MAIKRLHVLLSDDQVADLINALEDYRDSFRKKEKDAVFGFGLDSGYWSSRAREIEELLDLIAASSRTDQY